MKESLIKNTPLFAELSDEEQRALGKRMRLENYNPDEVLFIKDGESDALYLIKEGWVKLSTDSGASVVANLGPGSLVGETDFFQGRAHSMTARASGQVTVWALDNQALTEIIAERPQIGLNLGLAFGSGIVQFQPYLTDQLAQNPLLQTLSDRERSLIAQRLSPQHYRAGQAIYRSGDQPTGLFFIVEGTVRMLGDSDEDYSELGYGEAFGEMAVISGKPHSNTAQPATEVIVWQLSPVDFTSLTQTNPSIKTKLSQNLRATLTAADRVHAASILRRSAIFADLSDEALKEVTRLLLLRHVPAGEMIFSEGDSGDAIYIVDSGSVDAISDAPEKAGELVARFVDSDIFGEAALLTGKTRSFTAYASADTNLWVLYRTDFDNLLVKYPQLSAGLSRALRDQLSASGGYGTPPYLKKIALLGRLSRVQLDDLAARLQPRRYQAGSTIYYEGRSGDEMYFIEHGQVEHWANSMQGPILLETLEQSDFFGEIALLSGRNHPTTAYAIVDSDIWTLSKAAFDNFLKRYPNLGVNLSRILSERLEETLSRLRGGPPQRGLPPGPDPSRPLRPVQSSRPVSPVGPSRPYPTGPAQPPRPPAALPPVPVRPVAPQSGSRPIPPMRALPPGSQPPPGPPIHSQHTMGMRPVRGGPPAGPSPHSQHTLGMPPVQGGPPSRPPIHSQHTQPVPLQRGPGRQDTGPTRSEPPSSRDKRKRPKRRKKEKSRAVPPAQRSLPAGSSVHSQYTQPIAPAQIGPRSLPPPSSGGQPKPADPRRDQRRSGSQPRQKPASERKSIWSALPFGRTENKHQPSRPMPRAVSNRRLSRYNNSFSVWFAKRSLGAKLRLLFVLLIIIWLCGIMAPSWIIQALASTFEDNGALSGDRRSIVNQVRQDGAVGAMAALPFVETATATPTDTLTPTTTPTQTSTPTETPIPTSTHTPTLTPTSTETPTPVFSPTPTDTPTPRFTNTPSPPTDTPTPEPTPTPDVDFRVKSVRQLTPCENHGNHHIFIKVEDPSGQGINGVPVKIQWAATADGFVVAKTETKTNLTGQMEPGHIDFAMFKGTYEVEIQGGTSEVASGITPDYGVNEACGEDGTANSLYHQSFQVIFQRTF